LKIGGGLNYVTGPMGAGKTLNGVRRLTAAVGSGQYVVTNIELRPNAFQLMADHFARSRGREYREALAERLEGFYIYEDNLETAMQYRLPGSGEARGLFIWDEGQHELNNRDWRKDGRADILSWATQLRKLGFVGFLLSQHQDNTDAALRRVCNFRIHLQNQREHTRLLGLRITPIPLFLACWYPTNTPLNSRNVSPDKVERYFLSWHRKLYDTHGLFHGITTGEDTGTVIHLPKGGRQQATTAPAVRPSSPKPATETT